MALPSYLLVLTYLMTVIPVTLLIGVYYAKKQVIDWKSVPLCMAVLTPTLPFIFIFDGAEIAHKGFKKLRSKFAGAPPLPRKQSHV